MNSVLAIAEQMLNQSIANDKFSIAGESKINTVLGTFSSLMAFLGIGFFVYGSFIWLSKNYDVDTVILAMGGIFSLLSITSGITVYIIKLYKLKKMKNKKENFISTANEAFEIFKKELEEPVNDNPKTTMLITFISGYLAGERFL